MKLFTCLLRLECDSTQLIWQRELNTPTIFLVIPPCRYSFSAPPKLDLHVRPKLGEREVTSCHVTEWIEKKLQDEFQVTMQILWNKTKKNNALVAQQFVLVVFQKVFVMPNMDDIHFPLMHCEVGSPHASQRLSSLSQRSQSSSTESIERIPPEVSGPDSD